MNYLNMHFIKNIVLPLAIVILLCLYLDHEYPQKGLYSNLATEFIGIIVTLLFVDRLIRKHEEEKWEHTKNLVNISIRRLSRHSIDNILQWVNLGKEKISGNEMQEKLYDHIHLELSQTSNFIWGHIESSLKYCENELDNIIIQYGNHISSRQYQQLLELKEDIYKLTKPKKIDIQNYDEESLKTTSKIIVKIIIQFIELNTLSLDGGK